MPEMMFPDVASVHVSDRAQARIRSLLSERLSAAPPTVRLFAERDASGEMAVALGFDEARPTDAVVRLEGLTLVLDPETRTLCRDVHLDLDYQEGIDRGFVLRGPAGLDAGVAKRAVLPNSSYGRLPDGSGVSTEHSRVSDIKEKEF